jgi:hypothetical protein
MRRSHEQGRHRNTAIDVLAHPFKVMITVDLVINRRTSNLSVDTNRDTNPGAHLWTTMDGSAEIGQEILS